MCCEPIELPDVSEGAEAYASCEGGVDSVGDENPSSSALIV